MISDENRPMNHFFDDDLEYGEILNRDAWNEGKTDSDLEREADELAEYSEAMQYESDDWDDDLPGDARDLPPGFPPSLLEERYHDPLPRSLCLSIFERMVEGQRPRETKPQTESPPAETDPGYISDHEPQPTTPPLLENSGLEPEETAACGTDRHVKSTRKRREEQNAVRRKHPFVQEPTLPSN